MYDSNERVDIKSTIYNILKNWNKYKSNKTQRGLKCSKQQNADEESKENQINE